MKIAAAALFVFAVAAQPALAQVREPERLRWEAFGAFGGSFLTSVSRDARFLIPDGSSVTVREDDWFPATHAWSVGVRFHLTRADQVEASLTVIDGHLRGSITGPPPFNTSQSELELYSHYVSFSYVRRLPGSPKVHPSVMAGAGFVAFDNGFVTNYRPAGNVGLGLDVRIASRLTLRVEQRIYFSGAPRSITASSEGVTFNLVPSAGLAFHF